MKKAFRFQISSFWCTLLELRHYKSDSIQLKIISTLKLPLFSPLIRRGKKRSNFKIGIIFDWMESFLFCLCSSIGRFSNKQKVNIFTTPYLVYSTYLMLECHIEYCIIWTRMTWNAKEWQITLLYKGKCFFVFR